MPLITIAGRPCTGKTTHAVRLAEELRSRGHTVHIVNEESESVDKVAGYKGSLCAPAPSSAPSCASSC